MPPVTDLPSSSSSSSQPTTKPTVAKPGRIRTQPQTGSVWTRTADLNEGLQTDLNRKWSETVNVDRDFPTSGLLLPHHCYPSLLSTSSSRTFKAPWLTFWAVFTMVWPRLLLNPLHLISLMWNLVSAVGRLHEDFDFSGFPWKVLRAQSHLWF